MYDKADLLIPFQPIYVNRLRSTEAGKPAGFVNPKDYDFCYSDVRRQQCGVEVIVSQDHHYWETLPSSISNVAVGFFPHGSVFSPWPHVRIKFSPAKILQGHNVFGSDDMHEGVLYALSQFKINFPQISSHLDYEEMSLMWVDATYSAKIDTEYHMQQVFSLFERLASGREKLHKDFMYLLIGKGAKRKRKKLYNKFLDLLRDIKECEKRGHMERLKILKNKSLQDFAFNLLRFEASVSSQQLLEMGIPVKYKEFRKYTSWYQKVYGKSVCEMLWSECFNPLFAKLEGQTMFKISDSEIRVMIDKFFINPEKPSKRKSNAVFTFYRQLKNDGYQATYKNVPKVTFHRNKNDLLTIGLSEAYLRSLEPDNPSPDNVIPFVNIINIDFSKQHPDWYQPVTAKDVFKKYQLTLAPKTNVANFNDFLAFIDEQKRLA